MLQILGPNIRLEIRQFATFTTLSIYGTSTHAIAHRHFQNTDELKEFFQTVLEKGENQMLIEGKQLRLKKIGDEIEVHFPYIENGKLSQRKMEKLIESIG